MKRLSSDFSFSSLAGYGVLQSKVVPSLVALAFLVLGPAWPGEAARARSSDLTREGLPNIKSAAALVVDLANGAVLYERDADAVRPIASISKLVGALVIHEECKLDPVGLHEMTVTNREAAKGGDKSKLTTGWSYSHLDLLHAALMRSDNRALPALGEACGMDPAQFGERMTARVKRMGLTHTFFREPNGLSSENVSTARELVTVVREVVKVPLLTDIMATRDYTLTAHHKQGRSRRIKLKNTDRLLSKNVATIIGGKTGYTDIARYCFAVAARTNEGRDVAMVFLGAEGRYTRFADFTRVIKWLAPFAGGGSNVAKEAPPSPLQAKPEPPATGLPVSLPGAAPAALPADAPDATGEAAGLRTNGAAVDEKVERLTW